MTTTETNSTPTPPKIEYRRREYLSVSTLLEFSRCPRRYFYSKCGLTSEQLPIAADYGSAMHKALPVILLGGTVDSALKAFRTVWTLEHESVSDSKRNLTTAQRSIEHFKHTHTQGRSLYALTPPPAGALQVAKENSEYEVPWSLDIGLRVPLVGRFDSMCIHRDTHEPWIWELKTTGRMNAQFFECFEMSVQLCTYGLVGQTLGVPVKGLMLEGVLCDPKKVDNQTVPIPVQEHHMSDVLKWLKDVGDRLLYCEQLMDEFKLENPDQDFNPGDFFLKDFSSCTAYPHFYIPSYRCDYADLCRAVDWRTMTMLYSVRPPHDFLNPTIEGN